MADGKVVIDTAIDLDGINQGAMNLKRLLGGGILGASLLALKSAVTAVAKEAETLNASIRKASTLFGSTNVNIDALTKKITTLSNATGQSASDIGNALYDALSAGIPVTEDMGEALAFIEKTIKTSKGGFADLSTTVTATAAVLNSYGMSVSETDRVQGILLQTQNLGITTVAELGATLAQVVPTASSFGVSFEQVGAALATMTASGTKTTQATTSLNSLLAELGKQSQTAAKNLKEAATEAGLNATTFSELIDEGYDINEILQIMSKYAEKNGLSLVDMFGSIEAGKAALQITNGEGEKFNATLESMGDTAGLVDNAFETVQSDYERLSIAFQNLKSTVGQALTPTLTSMANVATDVITKFTSQKTATEKLDEGLQAIKKATKEYSDAQKEASENTNLVTIAMKNQSFQTLIGSIKDYAEDYDELVKKLNKTELSKNEEALEKRNWEQANKDLDSRLRTLGKTREDINSLIQLDLNTYDAEVAEYVFRLDALREAEQRRENTIKETNIAIGGLVSRLASVAKESTMVEFILHGENEELEVLVKNFNDLYDSTYTQQNASIGGLVEELGESTKEFADEIKKQIATSKENLTTLEEGSDAYVRTTACLDALTEAYDRYGLAKYEAEKPTGATSDAGGAKTDREKEAEAIREELAKSIEHADAMKQAFGESYDEASAKADAYMQCIQSLLALNPSENVADLVEEWKKLQTTDNVIDDVAEQIKQITENTDASIKTAEAMEKALGDAYDEASAKADAYMRAIQATLALDPSADVSKLVEEWKKLREELDKPIDKGFKEVLAEYFSEDSVTKRATDGMVDSFKAMSREIANSGQKMKELDAIIEEANADKLEAEKDLADARARGDEEAIKRLEKIIEGKEEIITTSKREKKEIESGASAWKAFGKASLSALAETLEGLGGQLAALAVTKAMSFDFISAGLATAGSVAAFAAATGLRTAAGKFADGGIVQQQTGRSNSGDQHIALVNPGELILNMAQQRNLADQINALSQSAFGSSSVINVHLDNSNFYGLDSPDVGKAIYYNIKQLQREGVLV